jgi:hypothetical protein
MSTQPTTTLPYDPETMALRDMFASHALAGMLPAPKVPGVLPMTPDSAALAAYAYADAMLRARVQPPKAAVVPRT